MANRDTSALEFSKKEEEFLRAEGRQRCKDDLHYLAKHILGYTKITEHFHKDMARDIDTPNFKFKLLLWPRGHYKSTMGTESYPVKKLLENPTERILITNAKLENSRRFLKSISNQFAQNELFRWLWRDWWINEYASDFQKRNPDKLDWITRTTQDELFLLRPSGVREASITTGAIDASLVSQHYSTIVADDLINRDYVSTIDSIEKSILYFKDLLDLLDPEGELLLIGTRWAHMDLYGWLIEEFGGIASLRVPEGYVKQETVQKSLITPDEDKRWMMSIRPAFNVDGSPIFPEEFTPKVLAELESAKGPYEFGAQYKLDPTPKENQKFQEEWFHELDILPDTSNMVVCITVDPAKSLTDQADSSAIAIYGYDDSNNMYLIDGLEEKLTIDELPEALFMFVKKWQNNCKMLLPVGFEAVGFQETYIYNIERMMIERGIFFLVEPIRRRATSKEERILRLVPRIKNGFYMPRRLMVTPFSGRGHPYDLTQRLKWQLIKFPFAEHDDFVDATADQLDIVKAHKLPTASIPEVKQRKADFIHPSMLDDKRKLRKPDKYDDAVR